MKHKGFTVVELIVVVIVIAILAAITVVGYGAWRDRTAKTEVMSDLNNAATAMTNYKNFNSNGYPTTNVLSTVGFKESQQVKVDVSNISPLEFCLQATSKTKTNVIYYINSTTNKQPTAGPCPLQAPEPPILDTTAYDGAYFDGAMNTLRVNIAAPTNGAPASSYKFSYTENGMTWQVLTPTSASNGQYNFQDPNTGATLWYDCQDYGNCATLRIIAVGSTGLESSPTDVSYSGIYYF